MFVCTNFTNSLCSIDNTGRSKKKFRGPSHSQLPPEVSTWLQQNKTDLIGSLDPETRTKMQKKQIYNKIPKLVRNRPWYLTLPTVHTGQRWLKPLELVCALGAHDGTQLGHYNRSLVWGQPHWQVQRVHGCSKLPGSHSTQPLAELTAGNRLCVSRHVHINSQAFRWLYCMDRVNISDRNKDRLDMYVCFHNTDMFANIVMQQVLEEKDQRCKGGCKVGSCAKGWQAPVTKTRTLLNSKQTPCSHKH